MKAEVSLEVCRKCMAACCRLGGADFTELEKDAVLKAGHADFFAKIGKSHYELRSTNCVCPYLAEDNSCAIQEVKPAMCRCWPVYPQYVGGKKRHLLVKCPLTPLLSEKDILRMRKEADSVPEHIIRNTFRQSKLPKQDLKAIKKRFSSFRKTLLE